MSQYLILIAIMWISSLVVFSKLFADHIYLWQIKEYRSDRMKSYFSHDFKLKKKVIFTAIFKIAALIASYYLIFNISLVSLAIVLIDLGLNIYLSFGIIQKLIFKKIQLPKRSMRNLLIFFFSLCFIFIPVILSIRFISQNTFLNTNASEEITSITDLKNFGNDIQQYIQSNNEPFFQEELENYIPIDLSLIILYFFTVTSSIVYILSFPIITFGVLLTTPLAQYRRRQLIQKAKDKISTMPELKVIGITGSFGKTSTKEILVKILSQKFRVGYTFENMNTEVGIALSILDNLPKDSEIFVMEAGAYKQGEISKCLEITNLDVAVVTNVGKAHLDIFKTVENIAAAKFELVEGLKPRGKAVLNFDNTYTQDMAKKTTNESYFYHIVEETDFSNSNIDNLLSISNIVWNEPRVSFKLKFKNEETYISTKVIGRHQLKNLAAAMLAALLVGIGIKELKHHIENITFESSHFRVYEGKSGTHIIDDGYNSNPDGFNSALSHLSLTKSDKKIIICRGIPEIGNEMKNIYNSLKDKIYASSSVFITNDRNFYEIVDKHKPNKYEVYLYTDNSSAKKILKKYLGSKTTILIEGRINPSIKDFIKNN